MQLAGFFLRGKDNLQPTRPRRLVVRHTLAMAPILFAGFVGFSARSFTDFHETPSNSPAQDRAILIYAPYVDSANKALASGDAKRILASAKWWNDGIESKRLIPLKSSCYEDSSRDGVKAEIARANGRLVNALLREAKSASSPLSSEQRVDRALLAIRVAEGVKFSDFGTVYDASNRERRAIEVLAENLSKLDVNAKKRVENELQTVATGVADLGELTIETRRQYYDFVRRSGKEPVSIEDMRRTVRLSDRAANSPQDESTLALVNDPLLASSDTTPQFLTELRVAWRQELALQQALTTLLAKLN